MPDDKSFSKSIIECGHGDSLPNDGSVCIVYITLVGRSETDMLAVFIALYT